MAVPHPATQIVARAPLTPATSRFVPTQVATPVQQRVVHSNNFVTDANGNILRTATPSLFHSNNVQVTHDGDVLHTATPSVVRAVATPIAAPVVAPAISQGVSSGYFTFPGAGIAFEF